MKRRYLGVAVVVMVLCSGMDCVGVDPPDPIEVPDVYTIAEGTTTAEGYNILFVPDGFDAEGLDSFRTVVATLTARLRDTPPFCGLADRLNFYRLDLTDSTGVDSGCGCSTDEIPDELAEMAEVEFPSATWSGDGTYLENKDLGAKSCWSEGGAATDCRLLWLGTEGKNYLTDIVAELDGKVSIRLVVVVANVDAVWGGGRPGDADLAVTVMGVPIVHSSDTSELPAISETATLLLAHEIGHAMGLHDEYPEMLDAGIDYVDGKNVWAPGVPLPLSSDTGLAATAPTEELPWRDDLCPVEDLEACDGTTSDQAECSFVSWESQPLGGGSVAVLCVDHSHVWEGAFYSESDYYRYEYECLMQQFAGTLCGRCMELIHEKLCSFGSPSCPDLDDVIECPAS